MRLLVPVLLATAVALALPQLFDAMSAGIYLSMTPGQYWAALNSSKLIYIDERGVYITTGAFPQSGSALMIYKYVAELNRTGLLRYSVNETGVYIFYKGELYRRYVFKSLPNYTVATPRYSLIARPGPAYNLTQLGGNATLKTSFIHITGAVKARVLYIEYFKNGTEAVAGFFIITPEPRAYGYFVYSAGEKTYFIDRVLVNYTGRLFQHLAKTAQTLAQLSAQTPDDAARAKAYQAVANALTEIAKAINGTSLDTTVNSTQITVTDPIIAVILLRVELVVNLANAFATGLLTYIDTGDIGKAATCAFVDFVSNYLFPLPIPDLGKKSVIIEKIIGIGFDLLDVDLAQWFGLNCTGYGDVLKRGAEYVMFYWRKVDINGLESCIKQTALPNTCNKVSPLQNSICVAGPLNFANYAGRYRLLVWDIGSVFNSCPVDRFELSAAGRSVNITQTPSAKQQYLTLWESCLYCSTPYWFYENAIFHIVNLNGLWRFTCLRSVAEDYLTHQLYFSASGATVYGFCPSGQLMGTYLQNNYVVTDFFRCGFWCWANAQVGFFN